MCLVLYTASPIHAPMISAPIYCRVISQRDLFGAHRLLISNRQLILLLQAETEIYFYIENGMFKRKIDIETTTLHSSAS